MRAGRAGGRPGRARAGAHAVAAYFKTFATFGHGTRRLLWGTLCMNVGAGVFGVLFNLYLVALGYRLDFIGLVAAMSTVAQAASGPVIGWLLQRVSARTVMMAGSAALAVCWALSALVTSSAALAGATIGAGIGYAATTIPASPYMMEQATRRQRSHLFSAYFASATIGAMVGSILSGIVPALAGVLAVGATRGGHGLDIAALVAQDRLGMLVGAMFTALGVWYLAGMSRAAQPDAEGETPTAPNAANTIANTTIMEERPPERSRRDVLVMLVATGTIAVTMGATLPFFNVYYQSRFQASTGTISVIFTLSGLVCAVMAFVAPAIGRGSRLRGFTVTRLLTAPAYLLLLVHPGLALAAVAYIARNSLGTISGSLENTFAMEVLPPRLRGMVAGWRSLAFNVGWSVGSLLAGVVVAWRGYEAIFAGSMALIVLGSAAYAVQYSAWSDRVAIAANRVRYAMAALPGVPQAQHRGRRRR